ncbi:MAG: serine/threonine protein kinase, partial [Gemmatimonadaceae bacterium]|nr:serine/threonine protein kinase [Gemmatimonadaceae bacterium]
MTDVDRSRRALALFDAAREVANEEREQWIAEHSEDDDRLADEVRALLRAAGRLGGILDAPAAAVAPPQELGDVLATALVDTYEVGREIGRGGMATVFRARERKHDREVVIKVLDPSMAQLCGAERFLREVRIAASLAHPHIVPLIDSGDADGLLFYVMPWMDGETLRDRLKRGPLPLHDSVAVLRDVASALVVAHGAGVVHRDLKPENVFLTAGHAFLLDFGIAKLLDDSSGAAHLTSPGFPIGTRRYMAPEQALAAANVDHHVDIFAWGLLGLEMLVDESLPAGEAAVYAPAMLARQRQLPAPLVALLQSCVATNPDDRPPTMAATVERLRTALDADCAPPATSTRSRWRRSPAVGVVLALAAGATAVMLRSESTVGAGRLAEPLAVTVLETETGDTSLSVIGRYAGDWLTDGLQRLEEVRVVPWSASRLASELAATSGAALVPTMREETNAGTVLTGTYYRLRDSLRLQAQLTDTRTGRVVSVLPPVVVPLHRPEDGVSELRDRAMGAVAV